jgi:class 3 adenylate cyclase
VCAVAHGGQIVTSGDTVTALDGELPPHIEVVRLGPHRLRGIPGPPIDLHQAGEREAGQVFPRLRT